MKVPLDIPFALNSWEEAEVSVTFVSLSGRRAGSGHVTRLSAGVRADPTQNHRSRSRRVRRILDEFPPVPAAREESDRFVLRSGATQQLQRSCNR
jgi:hypothetical protein